MDRSWILADRMSEQYEKGVKEFIKFAIEHAPDTTRISCPCLHCCFGKRISPRELEDHLVCNGIDKSYTRWTRHGESSVASDDLNSSSYRSRDLDMNDYPPDRLEEMTNVIEDDLRNCPKMFDNLVSDSKTPLYSGCKFTRLKAVLNLYKLKANNGWSDKSFTDLLGILKSMLPEDNVLPNRTYEAKRMLTSLGMGYERIHACVNDCILFRNNHASMKACPKCGASRYKKNGSAPVKTMWYLPIIPRFRRMYSSEEIAKDLTWYVDRRLEEGIQDDKIRHPSDSPQWKKIDDDFPEFGKEPRNLRLVLATDGMNPHGLQSSSHSTWPVILMIYNLPPSRCMKREHIMMPILISGPKQPGNDIDVYLAPLIEDLKALWEIGVEVYDGFRKESFNLRVVLFGTINDFPARANLEGYGVHGQCGCPICVKSTDQYRLPHSQKYAFQGHRKWLKREHRYRRWKKAFNGKIEEGRAPKCLTGEDVFENVKDLDIKFGKTFAGDLVKTGWKKRSIFFDLPYWKSLHVRHFLDIMHIEKNVFDSIIGTLLNVPGKTKDGVKARLDLVEMKLRDKLAPTKKGKRTYLPPAAHTLSRGENFLLCEFLYRVKVPEGYSSNISSLVSMKDLKLKHMKTHDCHVIMDQLLPIAIRSILPTKVRETITRLCFFFKAMWSKVFHPEQLSALQKQIVITLCELEMYFPPAFFDIMTHLPIHLVRETQLCGPAFMRSMYPVERYMKVLKGYVKNRSRPEGCIVERYVVDEAITFCTEYLKDANIAELPKSHVVGGRTEGESVIGKQLVNVPPTQREQAHLYVLHNSDEVDPYVEEHKNQLRILNPHRNENWISREHNKSFIDWFRKHIQEKQTENRILVSDKLARLSMGPGRLVFSHSGYRINGRTFYTKEQDERSTMQNSGVSLVAQAMHISSAKDNNPIFANLSYYGVIELIWELDYSWFRVPVFGCKWVDNKNGVDNSEVGFTRVNLERVGYKDEPFILASQAKQVFFVADPVDKKWSIVLSSNKNTSTEDDVDESEDDGDNLISGDSQSTGSDDNLYISDDELYMRQDHQEGIWINPSVRRRSKKNGRTDGNQKTITPTIKRKR